MFLETNAASATRWHDAAAADPVAVVVAGPYESGVIPRSARHEAAMRLFDLLFAITALCALGPLMILIGCAVRIDTRGSALFRHLRVGHYGVPFRCLKFRTMVVDADRVLAEHLLNCPAALDEWQRDFKLRDDPRITRLGRLLRRSSLDELPQLFNILVGSMSVVGPRPIVEAEVARYGEHFADYCSVRPGLTGPWQVSGRNHIGYSERVLIDSGYARTKSIRKDIAIITRTMPAVLSGSGSY